MKELEYSSVKLTLKKIEREIAAVEAELKNMCENLGLKDCSELEEFFNKENTDNPEVDLLYPEYLYLERKLEVLNAQKKKLLELISRGNET